MPVKVIIQSAHLVIYMLLLPPSADLVIGSSYSTYWIYICGVFVNDCLLALFVKPFVPFAPQFVPDGFFFLFECVFQPTLFPIQVTGFLGQFSICRICSSDIPTYFDAISLLWNFSISNLIAAMSLLLPLPPIRHRYLALTRYWWLPQFA